MRRTRHRWAHATAVIGCLCVMGGTAAAAPITPEMVEQDPRLRQPVTLRLPRVRLGELLAAITAKTGVTVTMADREPESGRRHCAFSSGTRLVDLLNGLWSLHSAQDARWFWESSGPREARRYHLVIPPTARGHAARLRASVQAALEQEAQVLLGAHAATEKERAALAARYPDQAPLLRDARVMASVGVFAESVPPDLRARVLRGEARVDVALSDLSATGRAYVLDEFARSQSTRPPPTKVTFGTALHPGESAPCVYLYIEGIGGYGFTGGEPLEAAARKAMRTGWLLTGDAETDPREAVNVPPVGPGRAAVPGTVAQWMERLADGVQVAVLAVEPRRTETPPAVAGTTLADHVAAMRAFGMMAKWRDGVLLVQDGVWFRDAEADVPWALVKRLRAEARQRSGYTLAQLAALSGSLTDAQARDLAEETPAVFAVARHRPLLALIRSFPGVLSNGGLTLGPANSDVVQDMLRPLTGPVPPDTAVVRILESVDARSGDRRVRLQCLSAGGRSTLSVSWTLAVPAPARR